MSVAKKFYPNLTEQRVKEMMSLMSLAYFEMEKANPVTVSLRGIIMSQDDMTEEDLGVLIMILAAEQLSSDPRITSEYTNAVRKKLRSVLVDMT
ncbi:MAG TPA: hypothetical protein VLB83_04325 [Candidatus Paceibacterota bacterium]|nr:hypothetical protein [Candidatus Paceibacterota bacterium]